jgi:Zn-dependent protease
LFGIPQPTPFDLHWRMFGIDVRVHPFFWLFNAVLGWWTTRYSLLFLLLWVLCVFVSVLIHELGHVLVGRLFGSQGHIVLYTFGGLAVGASNLRDRWQRVLVLFAGPLAQFIILAFVIAAAVALLPLERVERVRHDFAQATPLEAVLFMLFIINLAWPLLNLLPIFPLDGGQISREVLEGLLGHTGILVALGVSIGVAALLAVQMVFPILPIPLPIGGLYNAIFFILMAVSSWQLLQVELNRRPARYDDDRLPWE